MVVGKSGLDLGKPMFFNQMDSKLMNNICKYSVLFLLFRKSINYYGVIGITSLFSSRGLALEELPPLAFPSLSPVSSTV